MAEDTQKPITEPDILSEQVGSLPKTPYHNHEDLDGSPKLDYERALKNKPTIPTDLSAAKFIVQEANANLSAEQSLGALSTGLLKNTVSGGVGTLSTAVAGTDYPSPKFGGTGADGALSVSSGSTTLSFSGARYLVKNYTTISITGTAIVETGSAHANGGILVLKSQGDVTITSTGSGGQPGLDARGRGISGVTTAGGLGGTAVTASSVQNLPGTDGTDATTNWWVANKGAGAGTGAAGAGGAVSTLGVYGYILEILNKYPHAFIGAGGGSGNANGSAGGVSSTSGRAGSGGACVIIECGGALNFTGSIGVDGQQGFNATDSAAVTAGGGGGGSGGCLIVRYNTLTANSGTTTATGGTGGNCVSKVGSNARGGGGGGNRIAAGDSGTSSTSDAVKTGGDGADGLIDIQLNTEWV